MPSGGVSGIVSLIHPPPPPPELVLLSSSKLKTKMMIIIKISGIRAKGAWSVHLSMWERGSSPCYTSSAIFCLPLNLLALKFIPPLFPPAPPPVNNDSPLRHQHRKSDPLFQTFLLNGHMYIVYPGYRKTIKESYWVCHHNLLICPPWILDPLVV